MTTVDIPDRINASTLVDDNLEAGRGGTTAYLSGDEQLTYGGLYARMCRVVGALADLGVAREQRVVMAMLDTPWFPAVFLGAIRAGVVPVPLNTHYRASDVGYFLDDSYAAAVIADPALLDRVAGPAAERDVPLVVTGGEAGDALALDDLLDGQPDDVPPADTHRDDPAFWLYSSGSTGTSKGIVHLQHDIRYTCETYARHVLQIGPGDRCFSAGKAYHAYGLGNSISFPLWAGASAVLEPSAPSPATVVEVMRRFEPTLFFGVPTLFNSLLDAPEVADGDFASVRVAPSAAEPLPPEVFRRWRDRFDHLILDGIGSTEMLHIYCSNRIDDARAGTSGRPVPGYELRILDEDREPVEAGETGDLYVKGDSALAFYWHRMDETAATLQGEWFFSGDKYRVDDDGYYVYEGRSDDMIKVGGLWVSPIEIENTLIDHEAVSEAAAIGVEEGGFTKITGYVIPAGDTTGSDELAAELQAWCKDHLQRYQYPHTLVFVDDFPRTATGKIQRFRLRERHAEPAG